MSANKNNFFAGAFFFFSIISTFGCKTIPKPTTPPIELPVIVPEKTDGLIEYLKNDGIKLTYKSISLAFNPKILGAEAKQTDYVLLPKTAPASLTDNLRKDIKLVVPPIAASQLSSQGFTQVKALASGQKILLKKDNGFLFVSAHRLEDSAGKEANAYLLEFDNGRNLYMSPLARNADSYREFVYSLRDDGQEIYTAFADCAPQSCGEIIALLQPRFAFLNVSGPTENEAGVENEIRNYLKNNFFEGSLHFPGKSEMIPF